MDSHALWDSYRDTTLAMPMPGEGGDAPKVAAEAPPPPPPSMGPASFLHSLGGGGAEVEAAVAALGLDLLQGLGDHLREHAQLKAEVERLRECAHTAAIHASGLEARLSASEARYSEEFREASRLSNTLEQTVAEYRAERQRTLREMSDLKKTCARLKGLDANHSANFRRLELDYDKIREKLAKVSSEAERGERGRR